MSQVVNGFKNHISEFDTSFREPFKIFEISNTYTWILTGNKKLKKNRLQK